jgi:Clostripain family
MADSQDRQWTIAVDLAVNLKDKGPYGHLGAEDKMARLLQLKAQIPANSPVTIVAQQIIPETHDGKTTYSLKRYAIHNGTIDDLTPTPVPSKGTAQDLTDLLQIAGKQYPSARLGLVTNSHGNGDDGLQGDNGDVSLPQLQTAIKDGLKGSGHDKLDLVNFDACMMAQAGVLGEMDPVAKQLIASASLENANGGADGQKLNTWLQDLIKNPKMDGKQLAEDIVRRAEKGANDERGFQGTPTLAHFNLEERYPAFEKDLDRFSDEISQAAARDPKSKEAIRKAMGESSQYQAHSMSFDLNALTPESFAEQLKSEKSDLASFTSAIHKLAADGTITDPTGSLAHATSDLQVSQKALTEQFHGRKDRPWQGLTAYLPDMRILNAETAAERATTVGHVLDLADPSRPIALRQLGLSDLDEAFGQVQRQMKDEPDAQGALRSAGDAMRRLNAPGLNDRAFEQAEQALRASVQQLEGTGTFKRDQTEQRGKIDKAYGQQRDVESETPHTKKWGKFIDSVNK